MTGSTPRHRHPDGNTKSNGTGTLMLIGIATTLPAAVAQLLTNKLVNRSTGHLPRQMRSIEGEDFSMLCRMCVVDGGERARRLRPARREASA
jgi:hypothetical protein